MPRSTVTVLVTHRPASGEVRGWAVRLESVAVKDERPRFLPAGILLSMNEGAVLVVGSGVERALELGADEVIEAEGLTEETFARGVARARRRARGREVRDRYIADLVRRDDASSLELFAGAVGRRLGDPLVSAAQRCRRLEGHLGAEADRSAGKDIARSMGEISDALGEAAGVVRRMRALLDVTPTDEVVDFGKVVIEVAEMLRAGIEQAARLDVIVTKHPSPVCLPRWQAVQTVGALLANAWQAVRDSRSASFVEVRTEVDDEHGTFVLEVTDDGGGMPPPVRTRALDPFFSTHSNDGADGLGLVLALGRVQRVGGDLLVDSEPGRGTTVRVFLPLVGGRRRRPPPGALMH